MTNGAANSHITQALSKEGEASSIAEEQHAEVRARLKAAIVKEAHKHFASPSFPPELRLEVMKSGIVHGTSWWHVSSKDTVDDIWNAAFSSLLPPELWNPKKRCFNHDWLDQATRDILANTAKQAFLETAIFTLDAAFRDPRWAGDMAVFKIPSPLASVGARIYHLDVAIRVKMNSFSLPENGYHARESIRGMKSLKSHFPNLKTCVLTLDVHFQLGSILQRVFAYSPTPLEQFDKRLLKTVTACPHVEDRGIKTLHDEIAKLFDTLVGVGPGKSRFVRVRFRSIPHASMQDDQQAQEHFTYGPLVRAGRMDGEDVSPGARLLNAAFQLERTGPRLLLQEPIR